MPLTPDDRAAFLQLLPELGPDQPRENVHAFLRERWRESLDEVGADPGFDQVRAGLLRVLSDVLEPDELAERRAGASAVLDAYPEQVRAGDASVLLTRHPAWVGLSVLELAGEEGWREGGLERAVALATAGFRSLSASDEVARGEVLWAMAEQAEEAGWTDRARFLLDEACRAPFARPEHRAQARLVYGIQCLQDGRLEGRELLEEVAGDGDAESRTRVHARWVLASLAREHGDPGGAKRWLHRALDEVDLEDDPGVAERLQDALDMLQAEAEEPG